MKIIFGLGNPTKQYENTYHNVGFMAVDKFANSLNVEFSLKAKLQAVVAQTTFNGEKLIIVKPQTYMNLSGDSVLATVNFFKVALKDILVVYDDLDLPIGSIRYRESGSSGTHNGMRNIVARISSETFPRLRIGTKNDNPLIPTIDYVLSQIVGDRKTVIMGAIDNAVSLIKDFVSGVEDEKLKCKYNGKK